MLTCIDVKFIFDNVRSGLSPGLLGNGALTCRGLHF